MKERSIPAIIALTTFLALFSIAIPASAQADRSPNLQCTSSPDAANEPMTYLVGAGKLSEAEKKRLEKKWGKLTIPQGETERALERRASIESRRQRRIAEIKGFYENFKADPNSTPEEIEITRKEMEELIKKVTNPPRDIERLARKAFDWRKEGIDVGEVFNQGNCNTCWAFASVDAAAASLEKQYENDINNQEEYMLFYTPVHNLFSTYKEPKAFLGTPYYALFGDPRPFVQDLLNCMPISREEICNNGWHGKAFDFMVYTKGIPTAVQSIYVNEKKLDFKNDYKSGTKSACRPSSGFYGAIAWDYVNSPPDKLPSVEQLKQALIEHGPLVAPIVYDNCLVQYRGGVFNEQNLSTVNHVVLLVGWDDDKEAWLVKNSWGEEWGEKGFAWIKYGSNNIGMFAAWIDADLDTFKPSDSPKIEIGSNCSKETDEEILKMIYIRLNSEKIYFGQTDDKEITVENGVVSLEGKVRSKKVRKDIYKIVKKIKKETRCLKKIVKNLTIS